MGRKRVGSIEPPKDGLDGGRVLEMKLIVPLSPDAPSGVLKDVMTALRRSFPTQTFSIEFLPKGLCGKRYVNVTVPCKRSGAEAPPK